MSKKTSLSDCCTSCYQWLFPDKQNDKYPHIQYKTPEMANVVAQSQHIHKVPLDKVFVFNQPKAEFSMHPSATGSTHAEPAPAISVQPTSLKSDRVDHSHSDSSGNLSSADSLPTLEFSLYYDIQRNTLMVHLQQAYNLSIKSHHDGCNSCVVLYLLPNRLEVFESNVVHKTLHPAYDQMFHFSSLSGSELLHKQTLVFRIFEYTKSSSRNLLGVVSVPLADADLYGMLTKWPIKKASVDSDAEVSGDILFSLTYKPDSNSIQGIILRITNLRSTDLTGTVDPYVKVYLYHKGVCQHKWKSSIKKQCLTPVFNEPFEFDILDMTIDSMSIELVIMDYDRFSRDTVVGTVEIGSKATEESCHTHWEEVISSPNQAVSRWHRMMSAKSYGRSRLQTF